MHILAKSAFEVVLGTGVFFGLSKAWEATLGTSQMEERVSALELRTSDQEVRISQAEEAIQTNAKAAASIYSSLNALDPALER